MPVRRRRRGLKRTATLLALLTFLSIVVTVVLGCRRGSSGPDAGKEGGLVLHDAGAVVDDPSLPPTVVIVLEGGLEPNDPRLRAGYDWDAATAASAASSAPSKYVELMSGLPRPCEDTNKKLGTVTFNQAGEKVIITSSKTRARGTCDKKDVHTLVCDWVGMDGKPSVKGKTVTYGIPKRPITGAFDKKHSFSCKAQ